MVHPLMVARILADMRMDVVGHGDRPAARRGGGHQRHRRAGPQGVRRGSGALRGRRHQAHQARFLLRRGPPGGELPQDAAGHGGGHPRHHGQAGRPHAQHAHARLPQPRAARAHRPRDHRNLRAHRPPPRHGQSARRAGGPGLPVPRAGRLPGDRRTPSRSRRHSNEEFLDEIRQHGGGRAARAKAFPRASKAASSAPTRSSRSCAGRRSPSTRSTT